MGASAVEIDRSRWPKVAGEFETVAKLREGFSISRYGDGEFKMAAGQGYRREKANKNIAKELTQILQGTKPECLVGIPTMDKSGAKYPNWVRHRARFTTMLSRDVKYYSSFISRPDSAQWINTAEFAESMLSIWTGKNVTIICEPDNSMRNVVALSARKVTHIECPTYGAYAHIARFEREALKTRAPVVVLSVGPTATCLAHRLADKTQAIDIGSAGGFLLKLLSNAR